MRRLSTRQPVVALVVGRHDIGAFAASHTGALATSWRTTRAALAQAGAVLVDDERELVDAVGALSTTRARPHPDPGVGVVTAQAGPGLLLLDDLRGPARPCPRADRSDPGHARHPAAAPDLPGQPGRHRPARPRARGGSSHAVAADPHVDLVAAYALHEPDAVDLVAATRTGRVLDVPVVLGLGGIGDDVMAVRRALLEAGIAVAAEPRGVAAAVGALLADARAQSRLAATGAADEVPTGVAGAHDEHQAKALLDRIGITTPARRACADRAQARAAFAELGGPVAVKILDADVLHKTDIGGVHLGIAHPDRARRGPRPRSTPSAPPDTWSRPWRRPG